MQLAFFQRHQLQTQPHTHQPVPVFTYILCLPLQQRSRNKRSATQTEKLGLVRRKVFLGPLQIYWRIRWALKRVARERLPRLGERRLSEASAAIAKGYVQVLKIDMGSQVRFCSLNTAVIC